MNQILEKCPIYGVIKNHSKKIPRSGYTCGWLPELNKFFPSSTDTSLVNFLWRCGQ